MTNYHYYMAHGLRIASALVCPELRPVTANGAPVDVCIRLAKVPESIEEPQGARNSHQSRPNQFLLDLPGIARYLVRDGREIVIEPAAGSHEDELRLFLLGSAFGILFHQRGRLVLHGSAIESGRGGVIFVGSSGVGKSTLAAAFHQRGYGVLADDVCAIGFDDRQQPLIFSGLAHVKLWAESAAALSLDLSGQRRVRPQDEKYSLPLASDHRRQSAPLRAVYHLTGADDAEFALKPLTHSEKFAVLLQNTYRRHVLNDLGMRPTHFRTVSRVARALKVRRVTRPANLLLLGQLVELLEEDFL